MRAPELSSWWPDEGDVLDATEHCAYGNDRKLRTLVETVARRRALEELKVMAEIYCDCSKNGGHGGHDVDCQNAVIHDRIAAIEEEEA